MTIKITTELLDDLLAKARSATPGPWDQQGLAYLLRYGQKHNGPWDDGESDCYLPLPEESDADYIASANPTVVSALVAEITTLSEALNEAIAQFDYSNDPAWRADFRDRMIKMAKGKQDEK